MSAQGWYAVRPLEGVWENPTPDFERRSRWTFKASWPQTEDLLLREINHLDGHGVVLQLAIAEGDLRKDGTLRAQARPWAPGVRISFESEQHGSLSYATDNCEMWQHNVRSIALGLEALRAVNRFGIAQTGQQYRGYAELPAGRAMPASHLTRDEALTVVVKLAYPGADDQAVSAERIHARASDDGLARLIRRAKGRAHPDGRDGDRSLWNALEEAVKALGMSL